MNLRTMPIKTGRALAAESPAYRERERLLAGVKAAEVEQYRRSRELEAENRQLRRRLGEMRRRELAAIKVEPHPDAAENLAALEQIVNEQRRATP